MGRKKDGEGEGETIGERQEPMERIDGKEIRWRLLIWPGVRVLCFSALSFLAWTMHFINVCGSQRVGDRRAHYVVRNGFRGW